MIHLLISEPSLLLNATINKIVQETLKEKNEFNFVSLDFLSSFLGDDCSPCLDIRLSKGEDYLFHWLMIDLWERRKEKYMAYFLSARLGVPNFS